MGGNGIVLFGVRSPLLPDYEESCHRLGLRLNAAVQADQLRPRMLDRDKIVRLEDLHDDQAGQAFLACAFSPLRRRQLAQMANDAGLLAAEPLIDPTAIVASSTRIGAGCFINAGVVIGAAGVVGEHVVVNRATNIGHHVCIEDFTSIGPGCTLAGNVRLGEQSFIGAGSVLLPGVRVGENAVIAAGSVVKDDVPAGVLVAGTPAAIKRENLSSDVYGLEGEE